MLDPATGKALAAQIDPARAMPCPPHPTESRHKETVYLTVVDRDRMAVSIIYSIFKDFGSGVASDRFGILFHNRGAGSAWTKGIRTRGGGKRPMHTIIPAMLKGTARSPCRSASWAVSTSRRGTRGWSRTSSISA
jgi:gamma-glutamyltranspeptidase/glutathione hydrolase